MEFPPLSGSNSVADPAMSASDTTAGASITKRRISSGSGILSKIPFLRPASYDGSHGLRRHDNELNAVPESPSAAASLQPPALDTAKQTRKRKGSLRKVALLGRGAQREKRENKPLVTGIELPGTHQHAQHGVGLSMATSLVNGERGSDSLDGDDKPIFSGGYSASVRHPNPSTRPSPRSSQPNSNRRSQSRSKPDVSYASTTDDEDALHIPKHVGSISDLSQSSISEPYLPHSSSPERRRSVQRAKSPLSYDEPSSAHLQSEDDDWDYSETEWWGWVVLLTTWFVFVIGMGSCLGVWSWAWDVGTTPYAPPELEDDPTLPIVGYYPALAILSCIMAWVWVVVAWVGMKYFRHAKIGGD